MRFASIETDFWELGSAEEYNAEAPKTFLIPSRSDRESLKVGDSAKLIFHIEGEDEDGAVSIQGERMWVLITEVHPDYYLGLLANEPFLVEDTEDFYLAVRAEIPFTAEHVIAIDHPSAEDTREFLAAGPTRIWSRDGNSQA